MESSMTGKRPSLSREFILEQALSILDQEGLEALTLRRLGEGMDFSYTAIYRHIPGKAALLEGITETLWLKALNRLGSGSHDDATWQSILEHVAVNLRDTLLEHPNAIPLLATHPISTRNELMAIARTLDDMVEAGYEINDLSINLIMNLTVFTIGHVLAESAPPAGGTGGNPDGRALAEAAQDSESLGRLLHPLLETDQYNLETQFLQGVRSIIKG
jgi:AcrR family transcriptional regulator